MQAFVPVRSAGEISLTQPAVRNLWAAGTVLRATVVEAGLPGRVQLQIGHHAVEARTTLPLRSGETLNLRVSHSGELTVLENTARGGDANRAGGLEAQRVQLEAALRQSLPRQRSLTGLLSSLHQVVKGGAEAGVDPKLVDAARAFLAQFPGQRQLRQLNGFAELIARSGIAHEARAAGSPQSPAPDLKGALLQLLTQLLTQSGRARVPAGAPPAPPASTGTAQGNAAPAGGPPPGTSAQSPASGVTRMPMESLPPLREGMVQAQPRAPVRIDLQGDAPAQLLRQADAALARVQLSQLASVPVDDSGRQVWMFELALRGSEETPDLVQFRIDREPPNRHAPDPEADTRWSVSMGLDLDELGAIEVRVSLFEETVSASFRAEQAETSGMINERLSVLRQALTDRGLSVDCIACRHGLPDKSVRLETRLIEEQA